LKPVNAPWADWIRLSSRRYRLVARPLLTKITTKVSADDNSSAILALPLALLQHSPRYRIVV
jgi:hypothetical protein